MKRGTPGHPKLARFAKRLGIRKSQAVGMVELLHHFTDEYAWSGDIGRFDDEEIAERVDWDGGPLLLVEALIESGLVDRHPVHRLIVHDWDQHAPEYTKKKVRAAAEKTGHGWAVDDVVTTPPPESSGKFQNPPENSGLPRHGMAGEVMPDQGMATVASDRPPPVKRSRKIPLPDPVPAELHGALAEPLSKAGVDPTAFWAAARNWADRNGKQYVGHNGWSLALQSAVRENWSWVPKSATARGSPPNHAERVAESTKQAARNVLQRALEKSRGRDGEGPQVGSPDRDVPRLRAAGD